MYLACRTTFAPIVFSLSRSVVSDQCLADRGEREAPQEVLEALRRRE